MRERAKRFLERIQNEVLLGDGAVGTLLQERGVSGDISYEQLNMTRPEIVSSISGEYVSVGAELIETNSFCANHLKQKRFGLEKEVRNMAQRSAELARKVAGEDCFVAGSIGPLARRKSELDEFSEDELRQFFREPMEALVEGGVDVLILETFTRLGELELAVEAAKGFDVPIIAQMAFGEEGTTEVGVRAERAAQRLALHGVHVIGANCRSGPQVVLSVLERQATVVDQPLSAFANAGYAEQRDGRYVYGASPEYFAETSRDLVKAGARIIGGCCGTTPAHIRAIGEAIQGLSPPHRQKVGKKVVVVADEEGVDREGGAKFLSLLKKDRTFVTVEIEPPRGVILKEVLEGARKVVTSGVDAINVPDNALAAVRMDNLIFAQHLRERLEIPMILHLTCRDKNTIALQSDILGAQAAGVEAILAVTGDPASIGDQPGASSVYDINSIGLVEIIRSFNRGVTPWGTTLERPTDLAIGVALNPNMSGAKALEGAFTKLKKKVEGGAQFAETQPMYDPELLKRLLSVAGTAEIPICLGLMPIVSRRNADFLHNEVPGLRIPEEVRRRFDDLHRKEGEEEGLKLSRELIDLAWAGGVRHFYVVPPLRRYDMAVEIVRYIRSKTS